MTYPLDTRESIIVEFALRYLDDNLDAEDIEPLNDTLSDKGELAIRSGELEQLADWLKR